MTRHAPAAVRPRLNPGLLPDMKMNRTLETPLAFKRVYQDVDSIGMEIRTHREKDLRG
jgi:hypothetical protein